MPHSWASFIPDLEMLRAQDLGAHPFLRPWLSTPELLGTYFTTCTQIILLSMFLWANGVSLSLF